MGERAQRELGDRAQLRSARGTFAAGIMGSMSVDYEKLGLFYLGKRFDLEKGTRLDELVLYDSRDLLTHAVCVGMTGSGKTGLGIVVLEEAIIDGIPAIIIDPKGDMGNLLLTFPI